MPKQDIVRALTELLPKRLAYYVCEEYSFGGTLADASNVYLKQIADALQCWEIMPSGTEGYRTAEVALGGVDTSELSSKTMESKKVKGLYFTGEVVDVMGAFNFRWAWSSGYAAGQFV